MRRERRLKQWFPWMLLLALMMSGFMQVLAQKVDDPTTDTSKNFFSRLIERTLGLGDSAEDDSRKIEARRLYLYGAWQRQKGDYEAVLEAFKKAQLLDKKSSHISLSIATCLIQLREYEKAIDECIRLLKRTPDLVEAYLVRAKIYRHLKKYNKAIEDYQKALENAPENKEALRSLGLLYYDVEKDEEKTIELLSRLLELERNDPWALLVLGRLHVKRGEIDRGIEYYDRAIRARAIVPKDLLGLANFAEEAGNSKGAQRIIRHAFITEPENAVIRAAFQYIFSRHTTEVLLQEIKTLSAEFPLQPAIQEFYAEILEKTGHLDGAFEQYGRTLKLTPEDSTILLPYIRMAVRLGKTDVAETHITHLLELKENDPSTLLRIARIYLRTRHFDRAIQYYEKVGVEQLNSLDDLQEMFSVYIYLEDYPRAGQIMQRMLQKYPNKASLYFLQSELHTLQGKDSEATAALEKAVSLDQDNPTYVGKLAGFYIRDNNTEALGQLAEKAENAFKGDEEQYYTTMGKAAETYGAFERALIYYSKLIELDEKNVKYYTQLAQLHNKQREYDRALKVMKAGQKKVGETTPFLYGMGAIHNQQRNYRKAIQAFTQALEKDPAGIEAYKQLVYIYTDMNNFEKAYEYLNLMEQEFPEMGYDTQLMKAHILTTEQNYSAAEALIKALIDEDSENSGLFFTLGNLYMDAEQFDKAEEAFLKGIELNPDDPDGYNNLGYLYAEMGVKLDKAVMLIQKALTLNPNAGYILDSLGWVYFKKGEFVRAISILDSAARLEIEDPVIYQHLGDAYLKAGPPQNTLKALEYYRKAFRLDIDNQELKEKIQRLEK